MSVGSTHIPTSRSGRRHLGGAELFVDDHLLGRGRAATPGVWPLGHEVAAVDERYARRVVVGTVRGDAVENRRTSGR